MNNMKRDRGRSIEHFLRDALASPASPGPQTTCLSAEIAAAFVDAALTPGERSAAVAHAAGCARCQALLAAVVRTSPPAVSGPWWRLSPAGWLVPLSAAAAAGVLVWAVLPELSRPQQQSALTAPRASLEVQAPVGPAPAPPAASRRLEAEPERRASRQDAAASAPSALVAPPPPASPRFEVQAERRAGRQEVAAGGPPAIAAAAAPPTAGTSPGAGQEIPAAALGNNAAASAPERQADGASAQTRAQPAEPPASAPAAAPATARDAAASVVRVQTAERRSAALALAEKVTVAAEIVSPEPRSRWRILPGGAVQRSIDGGSTWQVQRTGVTVTLIAGASPSPSVCWLVGPGGTVLLSADGRVWHRVAFPETTDLVSVRATDDHTATVTTTDGRMLSTKDGGLTWVRSPGK